MKIDGKQVATNILSDLKIRVDKLKEQGVIPHLFIITFGENPQTESYLKQKMLRAGEIGAKITIKRFPQNTSNVEIYKLVSELNADNSIQGIIIQRPLIESLSEEKISQAIIAQKDVDGFHPDSNFKVPVAEAVITLIQATIDNQNLSDFLKSRQVTVIGKGTTAGRPTIHLLQKMGIDVNVIDSKTTNSKEIMKKSDIIISAVGKKIIEKENLKQGVILIGIGMYTGGDNKLKGDYDEEEIKDIASFYTPTPGGVGPVNVTMLMKNLVQAAESSI